MNEKEKQGPALGAFCKLDWRLFDPANLEGRFDGERYLEAVPGMK